MATTYTPVKTYINDVLSTGKAKLNSSNYFASKLRYGFLTNNMSKYYGSDKTTLTKSGSANRSYDKYGSLNFTTGNYYSGTYSHVCLAPIAMGFVPLYEGTVTMLEFNTGSWPPIQIRYIWSTPDYIQIRLYRYSNATRYDIHETGFLKLYGKNVNLSFVYPDIFIQIEDDAMRYPLIYVNGVFCTTYYVGSSLNISSETDQPTCTLYLGQTAGSSNAGIKYLYTFNKMGIDKAQTLCKSISKDPMQIFTPQIPIPYGITAGEPPPVSADVWRPHSMGFRQPF